MIIFLVGPGAAAFAVVQRDLLSGNCDLLSVYEVNLAPFRQPWATKARRRPLYISLYLEPAEASMAEELRWYHNQRLLAFYLLCLDSRSMV